MKILYVIDSLASKGGAERILTDKMNKLSAIKGYEVFVITCYQDVDKRPNAYQLSDRVTQINLGIPFYSQYSCGYPKRLWVKWNLHRRLKSELASTVTTIAPDVLVGLSYFNGDMVCTFDCKAVKILEAHEARAFTKSNYGMTRSFFSRIFMRFYRQWYFRRIERHADLVVTLTEEDAQLWHKAKRVVVIPNFSVIPVETLSSGDNKKVLAVGRLEWEKGFDLMIEAWAKVEEKHPDWQLTIYGDGTLKPELERQIEERKLTTVSLHPFVSDIGSAYAEASILALASRFEGFGLALLEAMRFGVPCVAFNCPWGPIHVVEDGKSGFIVENGNTEQMASRICQLIENEELRRSIAKGAVERAKVFDVDKVMKRWTMLFETI